MEKVLVISNAISLNLYRPGLEDYSNTHEDMEIDFYCLDEPKNMLSQSYELLDRLRYKWNLGNFRKKYYDERRRELSALVAEYDRILLINPFFDKEYFIQGELKEILRRKNTRMYFVDSVKSFPAPMDFMDIFKKVYVFEKQDLEFVKDTYGIDAELVTGGTSYYLFEDKIRAQREKVYDLCFVGLATPKRLEYLDAIASWCQEHGKSFFVAGHFWHTNNKLNYFIGGLKFRLRHPVLAKYVQNRFIQPCDLAGIYAKSRIVLNINISYHKSLNQRTFDIMFSRSLLVCDEQDVGDALIKPGRDFVMCRSIEDMIEKIAYYLQQEDEREKIAIRGKNLTDQNYLYKYTLDCFFDRRRK